MAPYAIQRSLILESTAGIKIPIAKFSKEMVNLGRLTKDQTKQIAKKYILFTRYQKQQDALITKAESNLATLLASDHSIDEREAIEETLAELREQRTKMTFE